MTNYQNLVLAICLTLTLAVGRIYAKSKHLKQNLTHDGIRVVAHLPLGTERVTRILTTSHYSNDYLYVEYESGRRLTLIDVTKPDHPSVIGEVAYPPGAASDDLLAVTGNAALVMNSPASFQALNPSRTVRIMSFADPAHPTTQEEFAGVTALAREDNRRLIFLTDPDGLYILQQHFAMDPAAEARWDRDVLGNR